MPTLLERLMARAATDGRESSAFFQALMTATVYAHIPLGDRVDVNTDRIRFIQFNRPDNGQLVLPFFTDEIKAHTAAQMAAQVIALNGRRFLELTRGATLMMNPNDMRCVLYPEEIDALLKTGHIARIEPFDVQEDSQLLVGPSQTDPSQLIDQLVQTLAKLPFVQKAYLVGVYAKKSIPEQVGFLIAVGGNPAQAERAIHAIATALQLLHREHVTLPVDTTCFDMDGEAPDWIASFKLEPFYDRSWGAQLITAPENGPPSRPV